MMITSERLRIGSLDMTGCTTRAFYSKGATSLTITFRELRRGKYPISTQDSEADLLHQQCNDSRDSDREWPLCNSGADTAGVSSSSRARGGAATACRGSVRARRRVSGDRDADRIPERTLRKVNHTSSRHRCPIVNVQPECVVGAKRWK